MSTSEVITDTDDRFGWASKTITTSADGVTLSTVTVYDDGNRLTETFDPSYSELTVTFEDLADTKGFALRATTYFIVPETGERFPYPLAQTKVDDNGIRQEWDFRGTNATYTKTDVNDVAAWDRVEDDGNGLVITTFDDGSRTYVNSGTGFRRTEYFDSDGSHLKTVSLGFFADGSLATRSIQDTVASTYRYESYENGVLRSLSIGNGPLFLSNIKTEAIFFDEAGVKTASETVYMDNRSVVERFTDGVLSSRTDTDQSDAYDWATINTTYSPRGDITFREIAYDDGRLAVTELSDPAPDGSYTLSTCDIDAGGTTTHETHTTRDSAGILVAETVVDHEDGSEKLTRYTDGIVSSISETWEPTSAGSVIERNRDFDAGGNLVLLDTLSNDGRETVVWYESGDIASKVVTNTFGTFSDFNWHAITTLYDANGKPSEVVTTYLDGRIRTDTFEAGVLASRVIADEADIAAWTQQRTFYEGGSITRRETLFDDGVELSKTIEGRIVRELSREDTLDAYDWTQVLNTYDSFGALLRSQTILDSQDATVFLKASATKLDYDGDGSEGWLFRETKVDPVEGKTITTYDPQDDIPAYITTEFSFLF